MISSAMLPVANHLWQSTLFAAVAALLTLLLRNNRAHARYCLWVVASAKFLVPFSLFVLAGSQFGRHVVIAPARSIVPVFIEQVNEPFLAEGLVRPIPASHSPSASLLVPILIAVWAVGFGVLAISWLLRWWRLRSALRAASPLSLDIGIRVLSSRSFLEPGVFGVFRPVLLLPDGIAEKLTPAELHAVLAHELCHLRRRDNLATVMHMFVEAVFWFHPLVWWLGARLIDERERACDEEVLRQGSEPQAYAEGILKVCELYLQSPLNCVAGVTGASLKQRIEAIMSNRTALRLSLVKKGGLAAAGAAAVAIPLILGLTSAPALRAQADPSLRFEVATVRRVEIPDMDGRTLAPKIDGGIGTADPHRISYHGTWLMGLMVDAFGVRADQIAGVPQPVKTSRYDIVANIPDGATKEQFNVMLGNLLRDRFHLRFHMDTKIIPVYALRVGKNGPKFKQTASHDDSTIPARTSGARDPQGFPIVTPNFKGIVGWPASGEVHWTAQDVPMSNLASLLESPVVGRPIVDETSLTGHYDFKISLPGIGRRPTDPSVAADPAPSVFTAVQEQLGLKLEPSTHSFPQLIIDSIDRDPVDN